MNRINIYNNHLKPTVDIGIITHIWENKNNVDEIFGRIQQKKIYISKNGAANDNNKRKNIDRGILLQTKNNYKNIKKTYPILTTLNEDNCGSGENICVSDLNIDNIFIGDIWCTKNNVLLQVTSPRKPCSRWTKKYNNSSIRHFILKNTYGGVFFKVLKEGFIYQNDYIYLKQRIQNKWSIKLIGEKCCSKAGTNIDDSFQWCGTDNELEELYNLEQLANREWKEEIDNLYETKK